jgi:DNA-binding IclR family transcriptional regulator
LGPKFSSYRQWLSKNLDIRSIAAPYIRRLGEQTQQTIHLAALEGGEVFYIDKYEAQKTIRMYSRLGVTAPLYCTGVAKAIVAHPPLKERLELARQLEYLRYTAQTIGGPEEYLADLEKVRERGYALDDREHEDYIHCVAVPVSTAEGSVALVSRSRLRL